MGRVAVSRVYRKLPQRQTQGSDIVVDSRAGVAVYLQACVICS